MKALLQRFISHEEGTTTVEYGIIAAFVIVVLFQALSQFGSLAGVFVNISAKLAGISAS